MPKKPKPSSPCAGSHILSLDIETFSSEDLSKSGVYRYAEAPDFRILLIGYSLDRGPVKVADLASGEPLPKELLHALLNPAVEKWAFNAAFERVCLSHLLQDLGYLKPDAFLSPAGWRCSMIWSAYLGLPMSLAGAGAVLGLDKQKLETGKALIRFFCQPAPPSLLNAQGNRNLPSTDPERWKEFVSYNIRDVETEQGIQQRLANYPVPDSVWKEYELDQAINDRGIGVDTVFVKNALAIDALSRGELTADLSRLTKIQNPNSAAQIRPKGTVLLGPILPEPKGTNPNGSNAPLSPYETLKLLYDSVPDVLSELIRTSFIPDDGKQFIVCDFSAIEARVIAWLAGESWRQEAFAAGSDIYCASASKMFRVPVEKHGVNSHLRQKGKIAELALGYGGGVGALKSMGALEMGVPENELQPLVEVWRAANPNIVRLWWNVDKAVKTAISQKTTVQLFNLKFSYRSGMLFIQLPSGRSLSYPKPKLTENRFGKESVFYMGPGPTRRWEPIESYGPKFVENIVQGISRDLLVSAMFNVTLVPGTAVTHRSACAIVAHVHDELILEADPAVTVEEISERMSQTRPGRRA